MNNKVIILLSLLTLSACSDNDPNATASVPSGSNSFGNTTTATSDTEIEQLTFADSNLEACVDTYASNNSFTQISEITQLVCDNASIGSADGIQNLTSLTSLAINGNSLTATTAAPIGQLTSLTWLNLNFNNIDNIEFLSNLTSLESLYLSGNPLSGLSGLSLPNTGLANKEAKTTALRNLTNLRELHLNATGITDITELASLTNLEVLEIADNQITSIAAVSSLTRLTSLNLAGTKVSDLTPLAAITTLNRVDLSNNSDLSDLTPLQNLTAISNLNISSTSVTDVTVLNNLTNLSTLDISNLTIAHNSGYIDSDADGVPDFVEISQGTDKNDPNDKTDTDGDGIPDYVENNVNEQAPIWSTPIRITSAESSGNSVWTEVTNELTPYHWVSGNVEDSQSTTLTVNVFSRVSALFDFDIITSTEEGFDILTGTLNGESLGSWSGNTNETGIGITLQQGDNEFVFTYSKDESVSQGNDNVQVIFPNTSSETYQIIEGSEVVAFNSTASDPEGNTIEFSLTGVDAGLFAIDESTGELAFNIAPQFSFPVDSDSDNAYEINVVASDSEFSSVLALTIIVNKDTDGDGVPDSVETEQGTTITDAASYLDSDADLVPDYVEEQQGTDPLNAGSFVDENNDGLADYFTESFTGTGGSPSWNRTDYLGSENISVDTLSSPSAVSYGDIDNDGDIDVVATYDGKAVWFENGENWNQTIISENAGSGAMVQVAELTGDDFPEVIYINSDNDIEVASNPGTSSSAWSTRVVVQGVNASVLRVGDIDQDDDIDIVATSYNDGILRWYRNTGLTGSWSETHIGQPADTNSSQYSSELTIKDVNDDGLIDFVVDATTDFNGASIVLFLNNGASESFEHIDLMFNLNRSGFDVADVNGDDSMDLVHFDNSGRVVHTNIDSLRQDNTSFSSSIIFSFAADGADLLSGDFDFDGDIDVVATSTSGRVYLFEQDTSWIRTVFESSANDPTNIVSAELNNDGALDFVYSIFGQSRIAYLLSNNVYETSVSEGYTSVTITETVVNSENDTLAYYITGDDAEFFVADKQGNVSFISAPDYANPLDVNSDNAYEFVLNVTDNLGTDSLKVIVYVNVDNDNDGVPGSTEVEEATSDDDKNDFLDSDNDGVPDYVELQQGTDSNDANSFLDSDEDGYSDYVEQYSTPAAPFFIGENIIFGSKTTVSSVATDAYSVTYADMDGDFDLDIVAALESVGKVVWYENGNDWFERTITDSAVDPRSVVAADFDNDGDMDVAAALHDRDSVVWYENNGTTWNTFTISNSVQGIYRISLAHMNSDTNVDIIATSEDTGQVVWLRNSGSGSWTTGSNIATVAGARSAYAADVTGNGFKDVVIAGALANTVVLVQGNSSLGTSWSAAQTISTGNNTTTVSDVAIGDMDGDGDLDIVQASVSSNTISWYENGNAWSETVVSDTATGAHDIELADLDDDGDLDIVAAMDIGDFISWFENGADWSETKIDNNVNSPKAIAVADITGNGVLNVVAASNNDNAVFLYNATIPNLTDIEFSQVERVRNFINVLDVDDVNGDDVTFELSGTDAAFFDIDPITGEISFNIDTSFNNPDDFNSDNQYQLEVIVTDGNLSNSLTVVVEVLQDSDGDQVPFSVEIEQSTSPTDATSYLDTDNDGVPDYVEEFIEYTNPNDAADFIDEDSNNIADYVDNATNTRPVWQNASGTEVTSESISIVEGISAIPYTSVAVDDDALSILKQNTSDSSVFTLDDKGNLSFTSLPEFNAPVDSNSDNVYVVGLVASDGTVHESVSSLTLTITVLQDTDGDQVPDSTEISEGSSTTDPESFIDSDSDGVPDYVETNINFTDANDAESFIDYDGNGSPDYVDDRAEAFVLGWYSYDPVFEQSETVTNSSDGVHRIVVGEFNGDDKVDIVSAAIIDASIDLYNNNGVWGHNLITNTAQTPAAMVEADIDNDGDLDIVAASSSGQVYWLNNGLNWQQEVISSQFAQPSNVIVADLDGDNDLDVIVTASTDGAIHWFENGNSWSDNVISSSYAGPQGLAAGDIDNDGDIDIAVGAVGSQNQIDWFENTGTSWTQHFVASKSSAYDVKLADINGDGRLDVITKGTQLTWYDGNNNWNANIVVSTSGTNSRGIAIADMDWDGDLDIVTSVTYTSLSWLENDDFGSSWTQTVITSNTSDVRDIKIADIDGNEALDVITASASLDTVQIYLASDENVTSISRQAVEGSVNFTLHVYENSTDTTTIEVSGADSSMIEIVDGRMQFAQTPSVSNPQDSNSDNVYEFTLTAINGEQSATLNVSIEVLEDSDGDLVPNVYEAGQGTDGSNANAFLDSDADGVPDFVEFFLDYTDRFDATDFRDDDNNNQPDYVDSLGVNTAPFWAGKVIETNSSINSFTTINSTSNGAISTYSADIDNDGDMDVLVASSLDNTIAWFENCSINQGSCTNWQKTVISNVALSARDVIAADIDNDGDMDVVSAAFTSDSVFWYENCLINSGNCSNWSENTISASTDGASSVYVADIDNDGDMDVLAGAYNGNTVTLFENCTINDGTCSSWQPTVITSLISSATSVMAADIDNDGDLDVLSSSYHDDSINWFENCEINGGSCSAWNKNVISTAVDGAYDVEVADLDLDGDLDVLAVAVVADTVLWFENCQISSGSCVTWNSTDIDGFVNGAYRVAVSDVDNDGDTDVVTASYLDDSLSLFKNCLYSSNNCSGWSKTGLSSSIDGAKGVAIADFDGDDDVDVVATSEGGDSVYLFQNHLSTDSDRVTSTNIYHIQNQTIVAMPINAFDTDGDTITYELSGNDSALFAIDESGSLSFINAPLVSSANDFDSNNIYQLTVTANDGSLSEAVDLNIHVKDVVLPLGEEQLYLRGEMNSWGTSQPVSFDMFNKTYYYDVELTANVQVQFKFGDAAWSAINIGFGKVSTGNEGLEITSCDTIPSELSNMCITPTESVVYRFALDYSSVIDKTRDKPVLTVIQQ